MATKLHAARQELFVLLVLLVLTRRRGTPLVEMAVILTNDNHTNMIREAYFDHVMTIFSAKYVEDNKISLDHGRLSCVSLYTLNAL